LRSSRLKGVFCSGLTYHTNPVVTSSTIATLDELCKPGLFEYMVYIGEKRAEGLVALARRYGFPATWSGVGAMFQLWFCEPK
jgi:glutamate-1-semialdehyde 2,1-aminomutase